MKKVNYEKVTVVCKDLDTSADPALGLIHPHRCSITGNVVRKYGENETNHLKAPTTYVNKLWL